MLAGLIGGLLLGAASALLLLTHGRIAGISGIAGGAFYQRGAERAWRVAFIAGLAASGIVGAQISPASVGAPVRGTLAVIVAGLLVGYGTQLGNGCTSGHGICGISRLSGRSIIAVAIFIGFGAATAMIAGGMS